MKTRGWRVVLGGVLALIGLAAGWGILVTGHLPTVAAAPVSGTPEMPRQEHQETPEPSTITTLENPSPTCYRPVAGTGSCYIQWAYLNAVASSSQYVISMTVTIDGELRAYHSGFFQTSMYVAGNLYGPGFRVTCGFPSSAGEALGNTYGYTVRARDTSGHLAANYGTVTCPADVARVFVPAVWRP
jgi:hypothetical protein